MRRADLARLTFSRHYVARNNVQTFSLARTQDIQIGQMNGFSVQDKQILIANVAGTFYAMDAICSHMGGYLPDGTLKNHIVTCPVHHSQFDVTTGKFLLSYSHMMDLSTYEVIVAGDEILVRV